MHHQGMATGIGSDFLSVCGQLQNYPRRFSASSPLRRASRHTRAEPAFAITPTTPPTTAAQSPSARTVG